jgi:predicted transcriptional regulator
MKSYYMEATKNTIKREKNSSLSTELSPLDLKVLTKLKETGPITRSQLVKITGIPRSTLYDSLFRLILKGMVKKYPDRNQQSRGRPQVLFEAKL